MTFVATTYHPKSVRNRCVIERFVASLCYFDLGVIVMPLHQIPFLFANWRTDTLILLFEKIAKMPRLKITNRTKQKHPNNPSKRRTKIVQFNVIWKYIENIFINIMDVWGWGKCSEALPVKIALNSNVFGVFFLKTHICLKIISIFLVFSLVKF